jgi:hypothetical protein
MGRNCEIPIFVFNEVNIFLKYTACVFSSVQAGNSSCKTVYEHQLENGEEIKTESHIAPLLYNKFLLVIPFWQEESRINIVGGCT